MRRVTVQMPDQAENTGAIDVAFYKSHWHVENTHISDGTVHATLTIEDTNVIPQALPILGLVTNGTAHPLPGGNPLPQGVETAKCEVCGTARSKEHIVLDSPDGPKIIGTACLHKQNKRMFKTAQHLKKWLEPLIQHPQRTLDDTIQRLASQPRHDTTTVIAAAMSSIRRYGYRSRSQANRTGHTPTVEHVLALLAGQDSDIDRYLLPAAVLQEWALNEHTPNGDFDRSLQRIAALPTVPRHLLGRVVYLPELHRTTENRRDASLLGYDLSANPDSPFVGEVGQRVTVEAVYIQSTQVLETGTTIVKMLTRENQRLTWFATNNPNLASGDVVDIVATVKDHNTFRGTQSTVVNRLVATPPRR